MNRPVVEVISQRFSCRSYRDTPIEEDRQHLLREFLGLNRVGPLGTPARFELVGAKGDDRQSLKGLGTYGYIKNPAGFIIGAVEEGEKDLEDYGYMLEHAILYATDLGLGTCWLGGTFSKSRFAKKISLQSNEVMPAVASIGCIVDGSEKGDSVSKRSVVIRRLPDNQLFFDHKFGEAISSIDEIAYASPLEMVRLAPSASNKQPWRLIRDGNSWHFFLQRTKGYGKGSLLFSVLLLADLQRVDMGIAMCHFGLAANSLGLNGRWIINEPQIDKPDGTEYTATWIAS